MIRAEAITEAEAKRSRGIMDLAPRQGNLYAFDPRLLHLSKTDGTAERFRFRPTTKRTSHSHAPSPRSGSSSLSRSTCGKASPPSRTGTAGLPRHSTRWTSSRPTSSRFRCRPRRNRRLRPIARPDSQLVRNQGNSAEAPSRRPASTPSSSASAWSGENEIAKKCRGVAKLCFRPPETPRSGLRSWSKWSRLARSHAEGSPWTPSRPRRATELAAAETLATGLAKAKAAGKSKLTTKHVRGRKPATSPRTCGLCGKGSPRRILSVPKDSSASGGSESRDRQDGDRERDAIICFEPPWELRASAIHAVVRLGDRRRGVRKGSRLDHRRVRRWST